MVDRRTSRGAHPQDADCFGAGQLPNLRRALAELCWLLDRGYSAKPSLKLVGDRHALRTRQRKALQRCAASEAECRLRAEKLVAPQALAGEEVWIDGYNVLLTVEAALCDGVLLLGRDGALRDMAAMSGHYRRVHATVPALQSCARVLASWGCRGALWYFDRPVSNSGRLKALVEEVGRQEAMAWTVELVPNPDPILSRTDRVVATADSAILDRCLRWLNLARGVVEREVEDPWLLVLA